MSSGAGAGEHTGETEIRFRIARRRLFDTAPVYDRLCN
jgi:hypothetical protein